LRWFQLWFALSWVTPHPAGAALSFNRDIRPILADHCFACHGPDEKQRKAGLRLDQEASSRHELKSGSVAIVPGKPEASALVHRITAADPEERMPPAEVKKPLSPEEIRLFTRWIAEGALYEGHWAYLPPPRPELPPVRHSSWPRNPIDRFVLAGIESAGLQPAPEASKAKLLRRVTLDLTGLPPTVEEVDAFLARDDPQAYEQVVDRLLASPHYGERMAQQWLDLARYGETQGYHHDRHRDMWHWRDWVIRAFNDNKRFDQFTTEQLAGDLLTGPTRDQLIATGFHRNEMTTSEGGALPEEYIVKYAVGRVDTTARVWLGTSMACAECHDHKFDPVTQKEYYQFFAFFFDTPEHGLDREELNPAPRITLETPEQRARLEQLERKLTTLETAHELLLSAPHPEWDEAQAAWERDQRTQSADGWKSLNTTSARVLSVSDGNLTRSADESIAVSPDAAESVTFELTLDAGSSALAALNGLRVEIFAAEDANRTIDSPGKDPPAGFRLAKVSVHIASSDSNRINEIAFAAAAASSHEGDDAIQGAIDDKPETAWSAAPGESNPAVAYFRAKEPVALSDTAALMMRLTFQETGISPPRRFRISAINSPALPEFIEMPAQVRAALLLPADQLTADQKKELTRYYRERRVPHAKEAQQLLGAMRKERDDFRNSWPAAMVMREADPPRETHIRIRGQYDQLGEKVAPGAPEQLFRWPDDLPRNRLGLARWLMDPGHPLTARVVVNRYWQRYFGAGLVRTAEDFGAQGEWPTHPQLLDWLATEFIRTGWDIKAMQRLIVTSATYRQDSTVSSELLERDPDNRLLARGPRFRLDAENLRDLAMAASGLLDPRIGGPSVFPYQPPGLWGQVSFEGTRDYVQSEGADNYRRGLYTYWRRSIPYASFTIFDAPSREVCVIRRPRTNTPLQALALLNDPVYLEAARALGHRVMTQGGTSCAERVRYAFRLVLGRDPTAREEAILTAAHAREFRRFAGNRQDANRLIHVGASRPPVDVDIADLAAWTVVASTLLNLDEAITRG
jgi:hypothetical protein